MNQAIIGSDSGLLPHGLWHYLKQYWLVLNWTLGNRFQQNLNQINKLSCKKMNIKMSSAKFHPFCSGLNEWTDHSAQSCSHPQGCKIAFLQTHGWPSTQPGTCTQPCPIVHTAVPPLFTQPCAGRTMSTAVCIYVAGLCASCPAV